MKKEIWNVPIITKEEVMQDKKFDMRIYSKTVLESKNNKNTPEKQRYIYKKDFNKTVKDYFIEGANKMSKKVFERHWKYIRKIDFNLVEAENTFNGIVYKLNYSDESGKRFVTIPSDLLNKLIECSNANVIKTYLILLYTCSNSEFRAINQEWLCEKIGFSKSSTKRIREVLYFLKDDLELIDTKIINGDIVLVNGKEVVKKTQLIKLK